MAVVRFPFATMAALKRDISVLGGHRDELSTWEQGLLRFAICLINRPRPSAKDLVQSYDHHHHVCEVTPRLNGGSEPFTAMTHWRLFRRQLCRGPQGPAWCQQFPRSL